MGCGTVLQGFAVVHFSILKPPAFYILLFVYTVIEREFQGLQIGILHHPVTVLEPELSPVKVVERCLKNFDY